MNTTQIRRVPITQIVRVPSCSYVSRFQTCELCYGHKNCCKSHYASNTDHTILIVDKSFTDWKNLEDSISQIRTQGKLVRLIIEKAVPDSVIWAISYDHRNLLQLNVDIRCPLNQLEWSTNLAHMAERCGVFFVYMVYPIIPNYIQPYHVLSVIDTIRSIPHCVVMLKFALFKNNGKLASEDCINVNGHLVSKEYVYEVRPGKWDCTDVFKHNFFEKIQLYSRYQYLDVDICGGLGL